MLDKREYCVGDLFKIYDKGLEREKIVVLSRFVLKSEHFVLLSLSTFETTLSKEEVMYLYGEENITYIGNISAIGREVFSFIDEKFSKPLAV